MKFDLRFMTISHSLEKHPILDESIKYKIKYLNALEYFTNKYSKGNEFSVEALNNYKKIFLGTDINKYSYSEEDIKITFKSIIGIKFKAFKFFTYRYVFVCDSLFINSFSDLNKGTKILDEIKYIYGKKHYKNLDLLFNILYKNHKYSGGLGEINYQVKCWNDNNNYFKKPPLKILITANMSAGKSTLINGIIGKRITRTMNAACTSKANYIYDKAFEDGFNYKLDDILSLDANEKMLFNNNMNNKESKIFTSTYFKFLTQKDSKLCIIDTPGVNSSLDLQHTKITEDIVLNEEYDKLLYVINAENCGTDDDFKYLQFIFDNVDQSKIIFVLNKLDSFRNLEDSIQDTINNLKEDLIKIGFENPIICPISAYASILGKKKIFNYKLTEDEEDDYILLQRKFRDKNYNLSKFYSDNIRKIINEKYGDNNGTAMIDFLINCGILCLEQTIQGDE